MIPTLTDNDGTKLSFYFIRFIPHKGFSLILIVRVSILGGIRRFPDSEMSLDMCI